MEELLATIENNTMVKNDYLQLHNYLPVLEIIIKEFTMLTFLRIVY